MRSALSRLSIDGFLLAIITMIILASIFPGPCVTKEPISFEKIANYGVSFIFLFYGLRLSPEKLKAGLANWKMHVVIQLTTFILLVHGTVMSKVLFPDSTLSGIILLPLMFYHALQLIAASIIARKMGYEIQNDFHQ